MSKRRKLSHSGPPEIAAIPTSYNGVQFKSRIEARWAIFFDLLGIRWGYEKVKCFTGVKNYVPDFLLQDVGITKFTLFEVKGREASAEEFEKAAVAAKRFNDTWAVVASGTVGDSIITGCMALCGSEISTDLQKWEQCPFCGKIGLRCIENLPEDTHQVIYPMNDMRCASRELVAEKYGIASEFLDYSGRHFPAIPQTSPMLEIASLFADTVCFDNPYIHQTVAQHRTIIELLRSNRAFASSEFISSLHLYALECRTDWDFPDYSLPFGVQGPHREPFKIMNETFIDLISDELRRMHSIESPSINTDSAEVVNA